MGIKIKKLLFCYGTRPEAIKLSPVISRALVSSRFEVYTACSGQHTSLLDDVKDLLPSPGFIYKFSKITRSLNELCSEMLLFYENIIRKLSPNLVIVQGDTATAYSAALASFHYGTKIGHVEAGLRTWNMRSPFPEEFYRQSISKIAFFNWAPTERALNNLKNEGVEGILTGNPIVDIIQSRFKNKKSEDIVPITLHRRENREHFINILRSINRFAKRNESLRFVFPAHPNPSTQENLHFLNSKNIQIIQPMKYFDFLRLVSKSRFIITDSGGIQEEAVTLRKKVLVCRDTSEHTEGIDVGVCLLTGHTLTKAHFDWAMKPLLSIYENPFGKGNASELIIKDIEEKL